MDTIPVTVARLGAPVQVYTLRAGATASDAARAAGMDGATVRVNNRPAEAGTSLVANDTVTLIPRVQGGAR